MTLKIGSLCTGYGGLDMAVEQHFNAETVWYSEFDKHAAKVCEVRIPGRPNLGDLTQVDWSQMEPIDILTAGYPCQPFSLAGARKGTEDDRHIWPRIADAIRILRPRICVFENVAAHLTLGFDEVLSDLASLGMDVRWGVVSAREAGAPHNRKRLWIVAVQYTGHDARSPEQEQQSEATAGIVGRSSFESATDTDGGERAKQNSDTPHGEPELHTGGDSDRLGSVAWGAYEPAIKQWERLTRPVPAPTETHNEKQRLSPKFVEWLMGLPDGWVTDVDIPRTQQLKALGNGVVPQQAALALQLLARPDGRARERSTK